MTQSNLRKGDTVTIEAVVDYATENYVYVVTADRQQFTINRSSNALKLAAHAFNVGDQVRSPRNFAGLGLVEAVSLSLLWVRFASGMVTVESSQCSRVEPEAGETFVNGIRQPPPRPEPQALGDVPSPSIDVAQYVVVAGDTLTGIANTFETTVEAIARQNEIADPDLIVVGQVLAVTDGRIPF